MEVAEAAGCGTAATVLQWAEAASQPAVFRGLLKGDSWPASQRWAGAAGFGRLKELAGNAAVEVCTRRPFPNTDSARCFASMCASSLTTHGR